MRVRHWNTSVDGVLSETAMRRKLESAGYLVARYVYPAGTTVPEHSHSLDKVDAVLSGTFTVHLPQAGSGARACPRST